VHDQETVAGVSVAAAARALGVGEKAIRRRILRGELAAVRVARPHGREWRVVLDPVTTRTNGPANGAIQHGDQVAGPVAAALRLAEQLAGQLAHEREQAAAQLAERARRIATLEDERFHLAGQLGFYQAQLALAREQLTLLAAPNTPPDLEVALPAPRRPRWQFWRKVAPSMRRA
jgi:hypothetical protein